MPETPELSRVGCRVGHRHERVHGCHVGLRGECRDRSRLELRCGVRDGFRVESDEEERDRSRGEGRDEHRVGLRDRCHQEEGDDAGLEGRDIVKCCGCSFVERIREQTVTLTYSRPVQFESESPALCLRYVGDMPFLGDSRAGIGSPAWRPCVCS